jgi:hypothetical protein
MYQEHRYCSGQAFCPDGSAQFFTKNGSVSNALKQATLANQALLVEGRNQAKLASAAHADPAFQVPIREFCRESSDDQPESGSSNSSSPLDEQQDGSSARATRT